MIRLIAALSLLISINAFGQKTAIYEEPLSIYENARELFRKQKFVSAQEEFKKVRLSKENVPDQVRSSSAYYEARCAAELFHGDSEYLLLKFIEEHPASIHFREAVFELGNYYYRQKRWKKAVEYFAMADPSDLSGEKRDELNFKLGYSHYMSNDFEKASGYFNQVKDGSSKYASASQYYYAHIAYVTENYETALQSFLKLKDSEAFAEVAPYYITQIYYKQGKFDEVLKYAPSVLDSAATRSGLEMARMVAESYYRKGNYAEALPYLLDYEKNSSNAGRNEWYQLGYCYYKTGDAAAAIPYFQKVTGREDSLSQNAYYHLADCYLKTEDKTKARAAFQSAYKIKADPEISEESHYRFARLSYELSFHNVAIEALKSFLKDFPSSTYAPAASELLIDVYASTKNYRDALIALDEIKNKTPRLREAYQKVSYYRGVELYMDNDAAGAEKLFASSLANAADPVLAAKAHYWKGEAQYRQEKYSEAVASYQDFQYTPQAKNDPKHNLANYNIGYAKFRLGEYANANSAFRRYIENKSATDAQRYNDALLRIGDSYFMMKDHASAMDYYNRAISANAKAGDYAIYQRAMILGIGGKMNEKINVLQKIFDKHPKSIYFDDALYEAGQASMTLGNYDDAATYYGRIIKDFPTGGYQRKAELGLALVYYNKGQDQKALDAYKEIITKYPNTQESGEALTQVRIISIKLNKVDEFLALAPDVSTASQDTLIYEAAEMDYTQGKCEQAVKAFDNYLQRFPEGTFKVNAAYYSADCHFRKKDYDKALEGYRTVIAAPRSNFTEKSLLHAGLIYYSRRNYRDALDAFTSLERVADAKDNLLAAQAGQMRASYQLGELNQALANARKVIDATPTDKDLMNEAQLIAGRVLLEQNDLAEAKKNLSSVAKRTNSEMTAESKYLLALIEYKLTNYKESQKIIFEIQKQVPSYDYWVARGFILLGDNYLAQADTFQARETYKSIVENYERSPSDPDDLKEIAQQKYISLVTPSSPARMPEETEGGDEDNGE